MRKKVFNLTTFKWYLQGNHFTIFNNIVGYSSLAGVGHWASSYIQIPQPQYFEGNPYLNDEPLNQMIALLAVLFTSIKGRREMLREHCPPQSPRRTERSESNPWVVLDSDGEDENTCDVFPLRENDYVGKLNMSYAMIIHIFFSQIFIWKTMASILWILNNLAVEIFFTLTKIVTIKKFEFIKFNTSLIMRPLISAHYKTHTIFSI